MSSGGRGTDTITYSWYGRSGRREASYPMPRVERVNSRGGSCTCVLTVRPAVKSQSGSAGGRCDGLGGRWRRLESTVELIT